MSPVRSFRWMVNEWPMHPNSIRGETPDAMPPDSLHKPEKLTPRQLEALTAAARCDYEGPFTPHVAQSLGIKPDTANMFFRGIYSRLGVDDMFSAVSVALDRGVL